MSATSSITGIPTLPPLAQLPPTPTPRPPATLAPPTPTPTPDGVRSAPPQIDSELAVPREHLEKLGLAPSETGVDFFNQLSRQYYDGTVLFDNFWELQEGSSGHVSEVLDFRYAFPASPTAARFLFNASHGLIQAAEDDGYKTEGHFVFLGDTSYVMSFAKSGGRGFAAMFASDKTAAIVIIAGDEELTQEQAFSIFSLAAQSLGPKHQTSGTPTAGSHGLEMATGKWSRQHVQIGINSDGTGEVNLNSGCCTGVTYYLTIDAQAAPLTATIVGRSFIGELDLTQTAPVWDVITFRLESDRGSDVLVMTMPDTERNFIKEIKVCRNGGYDPPCAT